MKTPIHILCVIAVVVFTAITASADLPDLSGLDDYAVFGYTSVSLSGNANILGRRLGSNGNIQTSGALAAIEGGVFAGGNFTEFSGASVAQVVANGAVYSYSFGDPLNVAGNLDAGGDVEIYGATSTIVGIINAGGSILNIGTAGGTGNSPVSFTPLSMPSIGVPPSSATMHGDFSVGDDMTLSLSAGIHVFDNITTGDNFALNLSGGEVNIIITGDVIIGDNSATNTTDNSTANAFISGGFDMSSAGYWAGTIYAPDGLVNLGNGCSINGGLYGDIVNVAGNLNVTTPAEGAPIVPLPPAILLGVIGLGLVVRKRTSLQA